MRRARGRAVYQLGREGPARVSVSHCGDETQQRGAAAETSLESRDKPRRAEEQIVNSPSWAKRGSTRLLQLCLYCLYATNPEIHSMYILLLDSLCLWIQLYYTVSASKLSVKYFFLSLQKLLSFYRGCLKLSYCLWNIFFLSLQKLLSFFKGCLYL